MSYSVNLKNTISLIDEIDFDNLINVFNKLEYVSINTLEPCSGLLMIEVEEILNNIVFSKKAKQNALFKLIIYIHCLGYTDKEIADGLNKIRKEQITKSNISKIKQRALKKINDTYKNIGLITILYEAFGEVDVSRIDYN